MRQDSAASIFPGAAVRPLGTRPVAGSRVIREYTYAYADVSPTDGVMDSLILPEVSTDAFALFLEEVATRRTEGFVIMFVYWAAWHSTKGTTLPNYLCLSFHPPHSPELNPTWHLWDRISENWFPNKTFRSLDAFEDTLVDALLSLENDV
jgi:hypothetical protein